MTVPSSLPVVTFSINDSSGVEVEWSCGGSLTESNEYTATPPDGGPNEPHAAARYQCQARAQGKDSISFTLGVNWNDSISNTVRTAMFRRLLTAHGMQAVIQQEFSGGGGGGEGGDYMV